MSSSVIPLNFDHFDIFPTEQREWLCNSVDIELCAAAGESDNTTGDEAGRTSAAATLECIAAHASSLVHW